VKGGNGMTTAEKLAKQLGNDGQTWVTAEGIRFVDLMMQYGARKERDDERELTRYEFADGSAIVGGVGAWDVEGATAFSWEGVE